MPLIATVAKARAADFGPPVLVLDFLSLSRPPVNHHGVLFSPLLTQPLRFQPPLLVCSFYKGVAFPSRGLCRLTLTRPPTESSVHAAGSRLLDASLPLSSEVCRRSVSVYMAGCAKCSATVVLLLTAFSLFCRRRRSMHSDPDALPRMPTQHRMSTKYDSWSKEDLIAHVVRLEASVAAGAASATAAAPDASSSSSLTTTPTGSNTLPPLSAKAVKKLLTRKPRPAVDFSTYPRRKIALKFTYLGAPYAGLAHQGPGESLETPTVEAVLMEALEKAHFIEPGKGWEACGFARCGRTDKGVSAAGQVASLWVRSRLPYDPRIHEARKEEAEAIFVDENDEESAMNEGPTKIRTPVTLKERKAAASPLEHPYVHFLNKLLPPTVRVLAWSPLPPDDSFDARYSCTSRHYKYFFSLNSTPSGTGQGLPLDVEAMREAASYLVGEHDFRNLCKVDGSKQISTFTRRIYAATISPVSPVTPKPFAISPYSSITPFDTAPSSSNPGSTLDEFFVLDLLGRAFLYHQVRHIMAVLFRVGARLEPPTIIKDLIAWETKPDYQMAAGEPLLLWDCGFPGGVLDWQYGSVPLPKDQEGREAGLLNELVGRPAEDLGGEEGKFFIHCKPSPTRSSSNSNG